MDTKLQTKSCRQLLIQFKVFPEIYVILSEQSKQAIQYIMGLKGSIGTHQWQDW
jgi:hypothetical protein